MYSTSPQPGLRSINRPVPGLGRYILLAFVTIAAVACYALLSSQIPPWYAYGGTVFGYCVFADLRTKKYVPYAIPLAGVACGLVLYIYIVISDERLVRMLGPLSIFIVFASAYGILAALPVCLTVRFIRYCVYKYL